MTKVPPQLPRRTPCRIALVGEAPGVDEVKEGRPFVGESGRLLDDLLRRAGIDRGECLVTNVFSVRPPKNEVGFFFGGPDTISTYFFPTHGELKREHLPDLSRLFHELDTCQPNVVVALGAIPMWALTGRHKITGNRGYTVPSSCGKWKVLPTYHPAFVLRNYAEKPVLYSDLKKALRNADDRRVIRVSRRIHIIETVEDLDLMEDDIRAAGGCAVDVETDYLDTKQITCVSFAPTEHDTYVIPYWNKRRPDYHNYDERTEAAIAARLAGILGDPTLRKVFHNALYDLTYLARDYGPVRGRIDDTMLLAHSMQPEWEKSLAHLGSLHTDERAWKHMRSKPKYAEGKADE